MSNRNRWLLPDGIDELLPAQAKLAEQLRRDVLDLFSLWGFQLVMPPLIEFADSLLVGMGEDLANHSFRLTDQLSGKPLAIRADITSQVARIDAHSLKVSGVNRLCYAGTVLHALPKSLAASRCPILAGAEIYGDASVDADIEIISLMLETLQKMDERYAIQNGAEKTLHKLTLDIGHIQIYRALELQIKERSTSASSIALSAIFDALQRKSLPDLKNLLAEHIADKDLSSALLSLPSLCGGKDVIEQAAKKLAFLGEPLRIALEEIRQVASVIENRFPQVGLYFDLSELRGYDYHTGLVFAAYADGIGSALANGGRYDELGSAFGAARPATGFNTDIKSLLTLVFSENNIASDDLSQNTAAVAAPRIDNAALWKAVCEMRAQGQAVILVDEKNLNKYAKRLVQRGEHWVTE